MGIGVWVLTGLGVPLLLGARATEVGGTALVAYVVLVVLGHLAAELRAERAADPRPA